MKPVGLFAVACVAIAACGNGTASRDGGAGASGSGGTGGAGGTSGTGGAGGNTVCATAVATQSCTAEGTVCNSRSCTNICQFCNLLRCMNGVWQQMEVAPATCFSCGSDLQCQDVAEYCEISIGESPGSPTYYRCVTTPAICHPDSLCSCLVAPGSGSSCVQAGKGEITVTFVRP